jgi:hypothetical protein
MKIPPATKRYTTLGFMTARKYAYIIIMIIIIV